jgi:hypothetical protein
VSDYYSTLEATMKKRKADEVSGGLEALHNYPKRQMLANPNEKNLVYQMLNLCLDEESNPYRMDQNAQDEAQQCPSGLPQQQFADHIRRENERMYRTDACTYDKDGIYENPADINTWEERHMMYNWSHDAIKDWVLDSISFNKLEGLLHHHWFLKLTIMNLCRVEQANILGKAYSKMLIVGEPYKPVGMYLYFKEMIMDKKFKEKNMKTYLCIFLDSNHQTIALFDVTSAKAYIEVKKYSRAVDYENIISK